MYSRALHIIGLNNTCLHHACLHSIHTSRGHSFCFCPKGSADASSTSDPSWIVGGQELAESGWAPLVRLDSWSKLRWNLGIWCFLGCFGGWTPFIWAAWCMCKWCMWMRSRAWSHNFTRVWNHFDMLLGRATRMGASIVVAVEAAECQELPTILSPFVSITAAGTVYLKTCGWVCCRHRHWARSGSARVQRLAAIFREQPKNDFLEGYPVYLYWFGSWWKLYQALINNWSL